MASNCRASRGLTPLLFGYQVGEALQTGNDILKPKPEGPKGTTPSRVAVVGCGRRFGTAILPVLKECEAQLVAVIDPSRHARDSVISGLLGQPTPVTSEELSATVLRDSRPDMVIVASPSGLHFEHAWVALASGMMTFVEKPLARCAEEADRLRGMSGGRLAVSEQRVHRTDLKFVRKCISSGGIGRVTKIIYHDTVAPVPSFGKSWRNDLLLAGGGVLFDLGYHTINTLQWLLDSSCHDLVPRFVRLGRGKFSVEDSARISCVGQEMELRLRIGLDAVCPGEYLLIEGTRASVRVRRERLDGSISLVAVHTQKSGTRITRHHLDNAHDTRSLRDFMAGKTSETSLDRHVATVRLLEAFYEHANTRRGFL
ncbi:Gfo/Idh/MocA family oxidoreductase [Streptomyces sp. NPDC048479]|uniref:Gfo/Idh/MocA family protein n=1 Tax=Streptomyces sp. NPDC048479 TaxID=3154725 RepID=UPI003449BAA2